MMILFQKERNKNISYNLYNDFIMFKFIYINIYIYICLYIIIYNGIYLPTINMFE